MTDSAIQDEVISIVRTVGMVGPDVPIGPDTCLIEDLGIDSLDLVGVFVEAQERFGVQIEIEAVARLRRIADIVAYMARRRGAEAA